MGLSAAQYRVERQTIQAGVAPNNYQVPLTSYNQQYNPYDPYNSLYNSYNPYIPYQNQLYQNFPGQSVFPGQIRNQPAGAVPQ